MQPSRLKYRFYVVLSVIFGLMVSVIIYGVIEAPLVALLKTQGLTPEEFFYGYWHEIHTLFGTVLSVVAAVTGFVLGRRGWYVVYIEKRFGEPHW